MIRKEPMINGSLLSMIYISIKMGRSMSNGVSDT